MFESIGVAQESVDAFKGVTASDLTEGGGAAPSEESEADSKADSPPADKQQPQQKEQPKQQQQQQQGELLIVGPVDRFHREDSVREGWVKTRFVKAGFVSDSRPVILAIRQGWNSLVEALCRTIWTVRPMDLSG